MWRRHAWLKLFLLEKTWTPTLRSFENWQVDENKNNNCTSLSSVVVKRAKFAAYCSSLLWPEQGWQSTCLKIHSSSYQKVYFSCTHETHHIAKFALLGEKFCCLSSSPHFLLIVCIFGFESTLILCFNWCSCSLEIIEFLIGKNSTVYQTDEPAFAFSESFLITLILWFFHFGTLYTN